ncbi:hypothetical protein ACRS6B_14540 [Nocardia asteroides]
MRATRDGLNRLGDQDRDCLYTLLERVFVAGLGTRPDSPPPVVDH